MSLAPASTLLSRIGGQVAEVLLVHGAPAAVVDSQVARMRKQRVGPTANRSVIGMMNEFTNVAEAYAEDMSRVDLLALSVRLPRGSVRSLVSAERQSGS